MSDSIEGHPSQAATAESFSERMIEHLVNLPETLEYSGEFGPELVLFLPFCCWLSKAGLLKRRRIRTYRGMSCFYDDLDCLEIEEKLGKRNWVPAQHRPEWMPVRDEWTFDTYPSTRPLLHNYPDLRKKFRALSAPPELESPDRPLLIIHNKYANEWANHGPVNHIPIDALEALFTALKSKFTIIYIRHGISALPIDYTEDGNTFLDFNDREVLQKHNEVMSFEKLYAEHCASGGTYTLNIFKNVLYSRCHYFISSQGGGAHHIALYSASILAVYHRMGPEDKWAYADGFYGFMASVPPLRLICLNENELMRAASVFSESSFVSGQLLLGHGVRDIVEALSPWRKSPYSRYSLRAETARRIKARHRYWNETLLLFPETGEVVHELYMVHGDYMLSDNKLAIRWDNYPPEEFILIDDIFVHVETP